MWDLLDQRSNPCLLTGKHQGSPPRRFLIRVCLPGSSSLQHTFEEMCVVHRLTHLQVAFSHLASAKSEVEGPRAWTTADTGPTCLLNPSVTSLHFPISFPGPSEESQTVGNPVNWDTSGWGLGGHGAQRHHTQEGRAGFFCRPRAMWAPARRCYWQVGGMRVALPGIFLTQGFSSCLELGSRRESLVQAARNPHGCSLTLRIKG